VVGPTVVVGEGVEGVVKGTIVVVGSKVVETPCGVVVTGKIGVVSETIVLVGIGIEVDDENVVDNRVDVI